MSYLPTIKSVKTHAVPACEAAQGVATLLETGDPVDFSKNDLLLRLPAQIQMSSILVIKVQLS